MHIDGRILGIDSDIPTVNTQMSAQLPYALTNCAQVTHVCLKTHPVGNQTRFFFLQELRPLRHSLKQNAIGSLMKHGEKLVFIHIVVLVAALLFEADARPSYFTWYVHQFLMCIW